MEEAAITMSERARLSVEVSELLRHPGTTKPLRTRFEMEGIAVPLAHVPAEAQVEVDLRFDALVDGVLVAGAAATSVDMECRRCLRTFNREVEVEVSELFSLPGEDGEEGYEIADGEIDLEPLLRDALVLSLPLNPVCKDDCKGLCATCGADRNRGDCGHDAEQTHLRWEPLTALRRGLEG